MSALRTILFSHNPIIAAYNEAQTTLSHWGVGGDYSRALSVVTNIVVGSTAGQGTTQLASNALAPYAAELIGNTFAHTDKPNEAAQLLSHAVLGGVLAYVNGGNAASGAIAGAGAEAAALSIAKELYPNAFVNGVLDRSKLTESQANGIVALSSAVGAFVGGISGGGITGATIDANIAQNAVENNYLSYAQKDLKIKQLGSCQGNLTCAKKVNDYWNKIDNETSMIEKIAEDIITAMSKGAKAYDQVMEKDATNNPMLKILQLKAKANGDGDYNPKTVQDNFNTAVDVLKTDFKITNPYTIGGHPGLYNQEKKND